MRWPGCFRVDDSQICPVGENHNINRRVCTAGILSFISTFTPLLAGNQVRYCGAGAALIGSIAGGPEKTSGSDSGSNSSSVDPIISPVN